MATVLFAFQRFEHESTYYRASAFLDRVVQQHGDLFELHQRHPQEFVEFLRSLVLLEPDTQLYLLGNDGTVLASSGDARLAPGFKVALGPVQQAIGDEPMPYVMGDDPERMDADAVIAARPLRRALIRNDEPMAGYLYLVCHKPALPEGRIAALRSSFALPALALIIALVALGTGLAAWITGVVMRPLRQLSQAVAAVAREGLDAGAPGAAQHRTARRLARRVRPARPGLSRHARCAASPVGGAAPARPLPPRRRQQPVARPALAAHRDHGLPGNAGCALCRRRRRAATIGSCSTWRCATRAMRHGCCSRWAIWRSSTSRSSRCDASCSMWPNCLATSRCALRRALRPRA